MGNSKLEKHIRKESLSNEPPIRQGAFRILRSIHKDIRNFCGASDRMCWEYMVEMLALATGWTTDTSESKHLWEKLADDGRWVEFFECWMEEVEYAKANRCAFSEPVGELLEDLQGANTNLGQYFTPMSLVRLMNQLSMPEDGVPAQSDGRPTMRGMEPCCGTGRILIDALVHNDGLFMHAIDLDIWMLRTAMLNVRMLAKWTSSRMTTQLALNPFNEKQREEPHTMIVIGGRSIFMHGNSQIVDTNYRPNWLCAGWAWKPHPWQSNIKIHGYLGSLNEWEAAGKPALEEPGKPGEIQFDYSMKGTRDVLPESKERQWEKHLLSETG